MRESVEVVRRDRRRHWPSLGRYGVRADQPGSSSKDYSRESTTICGISLSLSWQVKLIVRQRHELCVCWGRARGVELGELDRE